MTFPPARVPLPGGVSCDVFIERDANGREIVVKQALTKLRVAADWRANPARSAVEVRALQAIRELLGKGVVPEVLWEDTTTHRFAMERIDPRLRNWKAELMSGQVSIVTAARVGELLGRLHTRSAAQRNYASEFANRQYFEELRIEPFFNRIAQRNPDIAASVADAITALRSQGEVLVHGDYSPKNLLVDGAEVVILDLEVAHWGNPRFDVAFCLAHLFLKGFHQRAQAERFASAARALVAAYRHHGIQHALDAMLTRILGCLLLARLEGDSPVEYLAQLNIVHIKRVAVELIQHPSANINVVIDAVLVD